MIEKKHREDKNFGELVARLRMHAQWSEDEADRKVMIEAADAMDTLCHMFDVRNEAGNARVEQAEDMNDENLTMKQDIEKRLTEAEENFVKLREMLNEIKVERKREPKLSDGSP